MTPAGLETLHSILPAFPFFECVSLLLPRFGQDDLPIEVSSKDQLWSGFLQAKVLSIYTLEGCSIRDMDGQTSWENLVLYNVRSGLELLLPSVPALLSNLKDYCICTLDTRGPLLVQLLLEMSTLRRACGLWSCKDNDRDARMTRSFPTTLSDSQNLEGSESKTRCGCQAYIRYLHRRRVLPRGFNFRLFQWTPLRNTYVTIKTVP